MRKLGVACVIAVLAWVMLGGCAPRREPVSLTVAAGAGSSEVTQALSHEPTVFYGVTIAGAAALLAYERYCPCSL